MTSVEVSLRKKVERRRQETRHNTFESNGNFSVVPKDTFSTDTSRAASVMPPKHPAQPSVELVTRQSQVENAAKEKNMLENASDGYQIMTSTEVRLRKKRKRKKRRDTRHDAIESNGDLSAAPKDAFSTETSTAALAVAPTHPAEHSVGPVMRQSQVENASKEKNVLKNASHGSPAMTSAEVSLRKKDKRKRRGESRPSDIESNGNLSDVLKDVFSIETSTAAMVMPITHPAQYSVDPVMRQSQAENAAKKKNVLENTSDGSPVMTRAEGSLRKKDRRKTLGEGRLDATESNDNLLGVPVDIISTETSTAAVIAMPPEHPAQYSVDPVTKQPLAENEGKENHVLQDAIDGYLAMTNGDVNSERQKEEEGGNEGGSRGREIEERKSCVILHSSSRSPC